MKKDFQRQQQGRHRLDLFGRESQRLRELIDEMRSKEKWNLSSQKVSPEELESIFKETATSNCVRAIVLQWNNMPKILAVVSQSHLDHLKSIILGGNNIASIEQIAGFRMAQLEDLRLWNNKITNISPLRKLQAPKLKTLDLSSNLITNYAPLLDLHCGQLQQLNLQKNLLAGIDGLTKMYLLGLDLRVSIIGNRLVSLPRQGLKERSKIAVYFRVRHLQVVYS